MSSRETRIGSLSPSGPEFAIQVEGLSKIYRLYDRRFHRIREALHPLGKTYHRAFYALRNVNLKVKKGEILGIVGRNGSGKSTLLQILTGVLEPSAGTVKVNGNVTALLELGTGFNPELTGLENIYFHGTIKGKTKQEMDETLDEILRFAEIGDFISQPLKTYSSGMRVRLGFAVAVHMNPRILILDEVLAVGDELFKRKCFAKMEEIFQSGCTVLYVSHGLETITQICSRAILLDRGELILEATPRLVTTYYQHLLFDESDTSTDVRREIQKLNRDQAAIDSFIRKINQLGKKKPATNFDAIIPEKDQCEQGALFVPGFKATSTIVTRNADIDIEDIHIQTLSGNTVNFLITQERYRLKYLVRIGESFDHLILGFQIKNLRGSKLLAARLNPGNRILNKVSRGQIISVDCQWTCNLLTGTYLVDLWVFQVMPKSRKILLMMNDALIFKVQKSDLNQRQTGVVFLDHKSDVHLAPAQETTNGK